MHVEQEHYHGADASRAPCGQIGTVGRDLQDLEQEDRIEASDPDCNSDESEHRPSDAGLIAAQFRRYAGAQIFAFDKGRSMLTLGAGGDHYDAGQGRVGRGPISAHFRI